MLSGPVHHLHIVMNDPVFSPEHGDERVLMVNISSVNPDRRYDIACILDPGCHPFIDRQSYVYYKEAAVFAVPKLVSHIEMGRIIARPAINDEVFNLVRGAFDTYLHVKPKIMRFLKNHGI